MYIYAHTHTHTLTYVHTYIRTYMNTHIHTHTHTHTHTHMYIYRECPDQHRYSDLEIVTDYSERRHFSPLSLALRFVLGHFSQLSEALRFVRACVLYRMSPWLGFT